jgi:hypothetical protein
MGSFLGIWLFFGAGQMRPSPNHSAEIQNLTFFLHFFNPPRHSRAGSTVSSPGAIEHLRDRELMIRGRERRWYYFAVSTAVFSRQRGLSSAFWRGGDLQDGIIIQKIPTLLPEPVL